MIPLPFDALRLLASISACLIVLGVLFLGVIQIIWGWQVCGIALLVAVIAQRMLTHTIHGSWQEALRQFAHYLQQQQGPQQEVQQDEQQDGEPPV